MEKHTNQTNVLSGNKFYEYEGNLVELFPTFKYEITLNKYWENGFCQLESKFYKAKRLLHIKHICIIIKYKGYHIEKKISLVGVPQEFINEMNLSLYTSKKSNKK